MVRRQRAQTARRRKPVRRAKKSKRMKKRQFGIMKPKSGNLIVRGLRTILGRIPGGTEIASLFDFVFKTFAVGEALPTQQSGNVYVGDASAIGMSAQFAFNMVNIISKTNVSFPSSNSIVNPNMSTEFREGRIVEIEVVVVPTGITSKRNGDWAIGLQPYYSIDDATKYVTVTNQPTFADIRRMPVNVYGPADKQLRLRYVVKPSDGFMYQYHTLDTHLGFISIAFTNPNRTGYGNFTAEEFSCQTMLSGRVQLSSGQPNREGHTYQDTVEDQLKTISGTIHYPPSVRRSTIVIGVTNNNYIQNSTDGTKLNYSYHATSAIEDSFVQLRLNGMPGH